MNNEYITSNAQIETLSVVIHGVILNGVSATLSLHNSSDDSGAVYIKAANGASESNKEQDWNETPVMFPDGCYAVITGTDASAMIYYEENTHAGVTAGYGLGGYGSGGFGE